VSSQEIEQGDRGDGDIDEWLENRRKYKPTQRAFFALPKFAVSPLQDAADQNREVIRYRETLVSGERVPGTATSISDLEIIYPFLLHLLNRLENLQETHSNNSPETGKASIFGEKLHHADTLFSIVTSGVRNGRISRLLPTTKEDILNALGNATSRIPTRAPRSQDELTTWLLSAWTNFHTLYRSHEPRAYTLPGFGVKSNGSELDIFLSEELGRAGAQLAYAWATQYFSDDPLTWEFEQGIINQREVLVVASLPSCNLQIKARLDSVTRKRRDKKQKVSAQIIDLKTGRAGRKTSGIEQEILRRQMQISHILAEHFTGKYLTGMHSLTPPERGAFPLIVNSRTKSSGRLNLAAYRRFDWQTGRLTLEPLTMSRDERNEFFDWLDWYGEMINAHKEEIKKLLRRRPRWDL